jgi:hypothetical protein
VRGREKSEKVCVVGRLYPHAPLSGSSFRCVRGVHGGQETTLIRPTGDSYLSRRAPQLNGLVSIRADPI